MRRLRRSRLPRPLISFKRSTDGSRRRWILLLGPFEIMLSWFSRSLDRRFRDSLRDKDTDTK